MIYIKLDPHRLPLYFFLTVVHILVQLSFSPQLSPAVKIKACKHDFVTEIHPIFSPEYLRLGKPPREQMNRSDEL